MNALRKVAAGLLCLALTGCSVVVVKMKTTCMQPVTGAAEVEVVAVK